MYVPLHWIFTCKTFRLAMSRTHVCSERERLLFDAQSAVDLHTAKSLRLDCWKENHLTHDQRVELRLQVERSFDVAKTALDELVSHREEHGC